VPNTATVDLRLVQVPWNQVMDQVIRSHQLAYELDGSVLRVMTREAQTKEFTDQASQKRASEAAPDLQMLRIRLNYASAGAIAKLLSSAGFASERGSVEFEERTNMLIVRDTPRTIQEIESLVIDLDRPEPQVEIEARIVQANNDAAKALGVQWGFNGRVTPDLGNTTNLAFPNRGTLGGRVTETGAVTQGPGRGSDPRATDLEQAGTAINLPVTGATSALGLALGSINGAFNLDVQISALESKGTLQVISRPKITTQNNKQAEITQGFRIPIQVVSNNTITVQFEDAALKLSVLPQITAANTVIMRILLENAFPDFSRDVNGNPSINTQRADTQVQVADGMTTVIGGIMQSRESSNNDRTPGMSRLPILGWLFKRDSTSSESQELLVFLTPRIIRG
jgi:type IV pilus assembly protein PilQ